MGIEIEEKYGGTNSTFFVANLVIEELAKVDPSVSVMCDVHNTLAVTLMRQLGTPEQKQKYLPRFATDMVGTLVHFIYNFLFQVRPGIENMFVCNSTYH